MNWYKEVFSFLNYIEYFVILAITSTVYASVSAGIKKSIIKKKEKEAW